MISEKQQLVIEGLKNADFSLSASYKKVFGSKRNESAYNSAYRMTENQEIREAIFFYLNRLDKSQFTTNQQIQFDAFHLYLFQKELSA